MIDENKVKELVRQNCIVYNYAGIEDLYIKHPGYSEKQIKLCFLNGVYRTGEQIYRNADKEKFEERKNRTYVLHKIKSELSFSIPIIFPKYMIVGFYVKDDVVVFHVCDMSICEENYYKSIKK